ncbi:DUF4920 domain-containing protein [Segetibacter sp. 3557_3]|uniref:DUF4920 domain-containing protein n=1 Tax=Segetibacter sp. 3557_3 TaxID=2547429 RepID=UPI001058C703|nr:DUF4920 domain-containing protein [Segetibacter sp. 3557_3]TDH27819.1 DUF4920 domain-containing protein [Segetibacter sp. 3557_3]
MKKLFTIFLLLSAVVTVSAQPPKGPANPGMNFGEKVQAADAINVNDLEKVITSEEVKTVKIKGKVTDVCTIEGCWLKMETAKGKMMVKMKDHAFLVPTDLNGKNIVVDGTARMSVTSVKQLQHYAEDAGKSKAEIARITEPKKEIIVDAKGVLVL